MGGAGGLARQATIAAGGDENQANRAEREAGNSRIGNGSWRIGLAACRSRDWWNRRQQEAMALAKPWLDEGVDVPCGVHPLIDQIKEKTNDAWVDKIQNAFARGQNSGDPRARSGSFQEFRRTAFYRCPDGNLGGCSDPALWR